MEKLGPEPSESEFTAGAVANEEKLGAGAERRATGSSCQRGRRSQWRMSIEAVTSRIDQIMAMQQQLTDPSSASASSAHLDDVGRNVRWRHRWHRVDEL